MITNTKKNNSEHTVHRTAYLIDEKKTPFMVMEAFRNLLSNILFSIPKKEEGKGKVICVTSTIANEGKTTIATNLAAICANSGKKTVLVDCDLRKPRIKNFFKADKPGIVSYLSGQADLDSVIEKNVEDKLDVIIGRKSASNPIILLNDPAFDALIAELETRYEYIILDTPPVGVVTDATLIGPKADGVVIVTRQMYSNHRLLRETLQQLEFAGCCILGFVLNATSLTQYGGKSNYDYKYGYKGYGYGYYDSKKRSSDAIKKTIGATTEEPKKDK
jgi:capsular exopolysaccharide synthesis family protein